MDKAQKQSKGLVIDKSEKKIVLVDSPVCLAVAKYMFTYDSVCLLWQHVDIWFFNLHRGPARHFKKFLFFGIFT